jgi:SnoaL-like domain
MIHPRLLPAVLGVLFIGMAVVNAQQGATKLTTQDYVDIQQLYARYNLAIDTGDGEAWAGTFTPDGVFNTTNKGHDALVQFIRDWRDKRDGANRRHLNSNMVLTPTADGAKGAIYLLLLNVGVRPATIATTGIYEDVLVRTPQGWRFKSRIVHADPAPRTELK